MSRGDDLVAGLVAGDVADPDAAANDLLDEFLDGYPLEYLRDLIRSDSEPAQRAAAWIASELGDRVGPVLEDVSTLLRSPVRYARFFALDAVLVGATPAQGRLIAEAIGGLADGDAAVRWKTLRFLARASAEQLAAGVPYLPDEPLRVLTAWLNGDPEPADVAARLASDDPRQRQFAAAAAARLAARDTAPLTTASASADTEISSFAKDEIELLSVRRRR